MADNKDMPGGQDRRRINVNEDYEVHDWAKKFGVTPEQLRKAVDDAGTWSDAVERQLKQTSGARR